MLFWILVASHFSGIAVGAYENRLRIEPHAYQGSRGVEPAEQLLFQSHFSWSGEDDKSSLWQVQFHAEMEAAGRRDLSLDLDRAWFRLAIARGALTLGRIHPFDVTSLPDANRPWGLLAQTQAQNQGLLLGSGYGEGSVFSSPILAGWLGLHYRRSIFDGLWVSLSASPLFVPSMGAELSLEENRREAWVGRFGRRPPGSVEVDGQRYPLRYQLEKDSLTSLVFQPQLMVQLGWRLGDPAFSGSLLFSRAPMPDPDPLTRGVLDLAQEKLEVLAYVEPRFPQRWVSSLRQNWAVGRHVKGFAALAIERDWWAYEFGIRVGWLGVSFMDEPWHRPSDLSNGGRYASQLLQVAVRLPRLLSMDFFSEIKTHLDRGDKWIRAGVRYQWHSQWWVEAGTDVFGGGEGSYFGEWRTNDRVYVNLNWKMGTS